MPKVWLALFFGYNGHHFSGMQFQANSNVLTVQTVLIEKLHAGGFLPTNHHGMLQKQEKWSRAARTDKGVHAVLNSVSCLFTVDQNYFDSDHTLNRNKLHLDLKELFQGTQIVFHCFKRVTTRFQVRLLVKYRHYCYICPKQLFQKVNPKGSEDPPKQPQKVELKEEDAIVDKMKEKQQVEDERQNVKSVSEDKKEGQKEEQLVQKINACCKYFIGSHNFHNYSKNLRAKDPQSQRYILNFFVEELDKDNLIFNIIGQSFIYHQIRKMVGSIIMVLLNNYPPNYIENTFFRNQINMPLAPPNGLFLNNLLFDHYNKKKDIPQQIIFEQNLSIAEVRNTLKDFILHTDGQIWIYWIERLRDSIYHGLQYIEENDGENIKVKGVEQD